MRILNAESEADIDAAFARVLELKISALVVGADPFLTATVSRGKLGFECVVPEVTGPPSYHPWPCSSSTSTAISIGCNRAGGWSVGGRNLEVIWLLG